MTHLFQTIVPFISHNCNFISFNENLYTVKMYTLYLINIIVATDYKQFIKCIKLELSNN